ncbi:unnamed protein product, partial [Ectocarpus sp. 12 AP-2014]
MLIQPRIAPTICTPFAILCACFTVKLCYDAIHTTVRYDGLAEQEFQTPRVNGAVLSQFLGNTVCVVGKVLSYQEGDPEAQLETSDGAKITVQMTAGSTWTRYASMSNSVPTQRPPIVLFLGDVAAHMTTTAASHLLFSTTPAAPSLENPAAVFRPLSLIWLDVLLLSP